MVDVMHVKIASAQIGRFVEEVERFVKQAIKLAVKPVLAQVRDFTPRWKGGMVASAAIRSENDGREQVVYMPPGVVPMVHEFNGSWTRMPPHQPIFDWVTGKLGLSGKEAQRVTIAIRRKILRMGLTLPNKEGRGQMFKRTFDLYTRTRAHYVVFKAALRSLLPRS